MKTREIECVRHAFPVYVCMCVSINIKSLLVVSALHILFAVFIDDKRAIEPKEKKAGKLEENTKQKYTYDILNEREPKKKMLTNLDRHKTEAFIMDYISFRTQQLYRGRVL